MFQWKFCRLNNLQCPKSWFISGEHCQGRGRARVQPAGSQGAGQDQGGGDAGQGCWEGTKYQNPGTGNYEVRRN